MAKQIARTDLAIEQVNNMTNINAWTVWFLINFWPDTWDFGSISFGDNNSMSVLDEDDDDEVEDEDEEMDDDYKEEEERRLAELAAATQPSSKKVGHRSRSVSRTTILGDRLMEMNISSNGHSGYSRLGLSPKSAHTTPRGDNSGSGSGSLSHSRDSSREAALVEVASILANSVAPDPPQTPMISINDIAAAASATITSSKEEEAASVKAENGSTDGMTAEQMKVQLQLQQLMILQQQGQLVQIHEREKLVDQQSKLLRDLQRQLEIDEEALRIKKGDFDRLKERELADMAHERMQIQLKENELKMKEQQLNKIVGELSSKYNVKFPEFNFV